MSKTAGTLALLGLTGALLAGAAFAMTPSRPARDDGWRITMPATAGLDPSPLAGLRAAVERGDYPKTTSVLVVRDGELVYEEYFGDGSRDLLNDTRSATKGLTAI